VIELNRSLVLEAIAAREDHGWHEIIPMYDSGIPIRIFFDIDWDRDRESSDLLQQTLSTINLRFSTVDDDWAIASCHRDDKLSFHILSRRYTITLHQLRTVAKELVAAGLSWIDTSAYWYQPHDRQEYGSLRLPWQSKGAVNKVGPPIRIEFGEPADFLIMSTVGLDPCTTV